MHQRRLRVDGSVGPPGRTVRISCSVEGCDRAHKARGLCNLHYRRLLRVGDPLATRRASSYEGVVCRVPDCDAVPRARHLCSSHYIRWRIYGDPQGGGPARLRVHPETCTVVGCERSYVTLGFCSLHYKRWRASGDPLATVDRSRQTCQIDGCHNLHVARGWCAQHYGRWRRFGDPNWEAVKATECLIDGCEDVPEALGWCVTHYTRWRRYGDPNIELRKRSYPKGSICSIEGCDRPVKSRNWCELHYERWHTHGDPLLSLWEIEMDAACKLYRLFDENWVLLYVGISVRPDKRMNEHARSKEWWPLVEHFLLTDCVSRREALDLETSIIRNERPIFNIVHNEPDN